MWKWRCDETGVWGRVQLRAMRWIEVNWIRLRWIDRESLLRPETWDISVSFACESGERGGGNLHLFHPHLTLTLTLHFCGEVECGWPSHSSSWPWGRGSTVTDHLPLLGGYNNDSKVEPLKNVWVGWSGSGGLLPIENHQPSKGVARNTWPADA